MNYSIQIREKALKELKSVPKADAKRILEKIKQLGNNLSGNVKRLTNHTPEYRLRVGDYRILFEIENNTVVIYHIKHRREAY